MRPRRIRKLHTHSQSSRSAERTTKYLSMRQRGESGTVESRFSRYNRVRNKSSQCRTHTYLKRFWNGEILAQHRCEDSFKCLLPVNPVLHLRYFQRPHHLIISIDFPYVSRD